MPRLSKIGAAALAAFGWTSGSAVSASYLVVAGGGGGGKRVAGAGGAGGLLSGTASLNPTLSYTVTVGAGGAGSSNYNSAGTNGSNSVFNTATSIGGGGGAGSGIKNGVSGGSGGGSSDVGTVGTGTAGQGNNGGVGSGTASAYGGGGGGGASAVGGNGSSTVAGSGGAGTASSISGSSVTYAGGGGGGSNGGTAGTGGSGGGGAGTTSDSTATAGTANLGGGGGGCGGLSTATGTTFGGQGGSGVVIISYVGAQQFSGGVVTSSGGNTIHTFTTSGTLGPVTPLSANYLVVAGGAGGGGTGGTYGGGGGAGGFRSFTGLVIDPYSTYLVTVGAGGAAGVNGSDSFFSTITSTGGGRGGEVYAANTGGSGGGGGYNFNPTGAAGNTPSTSPSQGNSGGNGFAGVGSPYTGGGGGGAGAAGSTYLGSVGGAGGIGATSSISGTSTYYAGGGGGASGISTGGAGGTGGGGTGSGNGGAINPIAGTANTGGGGGGGGYTAAAGGSGVVIISYAGSTQLMAGGVVTIAGGNVIHTFNSSGYLTPLTLLTRSLRFRSSASAYLNRTFGTPTNNIKWTWSGWIKRGKISGYQRIIGVGSDASGVNQGSLYFDTSAQIGFFQGDGSGSTEAYLITNALYRDPAAWYHISFVYDSANATSANRLLMYVNGVQVTSFASSTYPSSSLASKINANAVNHAIGVLPTSSTNFFDGYMAEVNFIDGQALAPTAFGTVNSYGVWQPITYGGSYGTNGFRLPFTNNASTTTLGYDFSPQGNNWTTNNISVTAGVTYDSMTDVPTLTSATAANFATLNPLLYSAAYGYKTLSNGNLTTVGTSATNNGNDYSTIAFSTGKFYAEFTVIGASGIYPMSGIIDVASVSNGTGTVGYVNNSVAYLASGSKLINNVTTAYGSSYTAGDVIGVAVDATTGTITFYKNNTSQGVAWTWTGGSIQFFFGTGEYQSGNGFNCNFGQRPFSYTPPTGYLALNTFNL